MDTERGARARGSQPEPSAWRATLGDGVLGAIAHASARRRGGPDDPDVVGRFIRRGEWNERNAGWNPLRPEPAEVMPLLDQEMELKASAQDEVIGAMVCILLRGGKSGCSSDDGGEVEEDDPCECEDDERDAECRERRLGCRLREHLAGGLSVFDAPPEEHKGASLATLALQGLGVGIEGMVCEEGREALRSAASRALAGGQLPIVRFPLEGNDDGAQVDLAILTLHLCYWMFSPVDLESFLPKVTRERMIRLSDETFGRLWAPRAK